MIALIKSIKHFFPVRAVIGDQNYAIIHLKLERLRSEGINAPTIEGVRKNQYDYENYFSLLAKKDSLNLSEARILADLLTLLCLNKQKAIESGKSFRFDTDYHGSAKGSFLKRLNQNFKKPFFKNFPNDYFCFMKKDNGKTYDFIDLSGEIIRKEIMSNPSIERIHHNSSYWLRRYLGQLKGWDKNHLSADESCILADLLTIQYYVKDKVLSEGLHFMNDQGQFIHIDEAAFRQRVHDNFEKPFFKNLNAHFKERAFQGHVSYPTKERSFFNSIPVDTVNGIYLLDGGNIKDGVEAADDTKITYQFQKPIDSQQMKTIIISIYGGYQKTWYNTNLNYTLPDRTMGFIQLNLPDCASDIRQVNQLTPDHFKDTHARYLRITSQFIQKIKKQYPNVKIFLQGSSFGGFFVTSYGLLQSLRSPDQQLDLEKVDQIYQPFAANALRDWFKDQKMTPIDGIISYVGGIVKMRQIIQERTPNHYYRIYPFASEFNIPTFFHWNFDDDRVLLKDQLLFLKQTVDDPLNPLITISVNRKGAQDEFRDIENWGEDEKERIQKIIDGGEDTSVYGHFTNHDLSLQDKVLHFINHGRELADSPLHKAQQERLFLLYSRILYDRDGELIQRFLSNLRHVQKELENRLKVSQAENPELKILPESSRLTKEEIIEKSLAGIPLAPKSLFDFIWTKQRSRLNVISLQFNQSLSLPFRFKIYGDSTTDNYAFENIWDLVYNCKDPQFMEEVQRFFQSTEELRTIYKQAQENLYHDLMAKVTTEKLWTVDRSKIPKIRIKNARDNLRQELENKDRELYEKIKKMWEKKDMESASTAAPSASAAPSAQPG